MPFSRDPRMDRRRRVLRETVPTEDGVATSTPRARTRRGATATEEESLDNQPRRSAGYSQDVRRTCQHRLVQLIPVRRRAFLATIVISCLIPAVLLVAHYLVYVSGTLRLYGNPLAVMLDAGHSRGLCAWLCSQLWLLCLGATIFTFRLRRHKLDDYQGEYRLWFWLVSTCIVGSLDSTTGVIEIFGLAMDRWSQLNLGWSGKAVVQATLATLIGILGLRLCSELKNVPSSLVFWLVGLLAWAGSAVLSQELFKIDLSSQFRYWLRSALWIGGMTSIWLAALAYLRNVYIEAQRRFLLRGHLAASVSCTWRERVASTMPGIPSLPKLSLRRSADADQQKGKPAAEATEGSETRRRFGLPSLMRRKPAVDASSNSDKLSEDGNTGKQRAEPERGASQSRPQTSASPLRQVDASQTQQSVKPTVQPTLNSKPDSTAAAAARAEKDEASQNAATQPKKSMFSRFMRTPKNSDDAPEYAKVDRSKASENVTATQKAAHAGDQRTADQRTADQRTADQRTADQRTADQRTVEKSRTDKPAAEGEQERGTKKGWLPKIRLPKPKLPRIPMPRLPKIGMPKLKLPSFRLPPPDHGAEKNEAAKPQLKPVDSSRPLPSASSSSINTADSAARPLSKAERKRLKKIQDDQESQRRAA